MKKYIKGIAEVKDGVISVAVASTGREDRDGEVLKPEGWLLDEYKKNPVLLYNHNPSEEPIGKADNVRIEEGKLMFTPTFATEISDRAKRMFEYVKAGILNTFSVGFMPLESEGNQFLKQELLEISLVPVPSNPDARVLRSKGFDPDLFKKDVLVKTDAEVIIELKKEIEKLKKDLEDIHHKPEENEETIRIPVEPAADHEGHKIRTIVISVDEGIKALYCVDDKKNITYLFDKSKGWTMAKAEAWVKEHKNLIARSKETENSDKSAKRKAEYSPLDLLTKRALQEVVKRCNETLYELNKKGGEK